jgi:predicted nucleic acid-binding protein
MKVLVDTNIVLDVLLERHPFSKDSFVIFQLANLKRISGFLSATSITDIFYLVRKQRSDSEEVYRMIDKLTDLFSVIPVSETTIAAALALRWKDFEDAVQYVAAKENGVTHIITRNKADYETDDIPCVSPVEFTESALNPGD